MLNSVRHITRRRGVVADFLGHLVLGKDLHFLELRDELVDPRRARHLVVLMSLNEESVSNS